MTLWEEAAGGRAGGGAEGRVGGRAEGRAGGGGGAKTGTGTGELITGEAPRSDVTLFTALDGCVCVCVGVHM